MTLIKLPRQPMTLASAFAKRALCAFTLALVSFTSYPSQVWAQSSRPINNIPSSVRVRSLQPQQAPLEEPDFSGYGRPGRRAGGGSRGDCPSTDSPLTALMPVTNWGKTVAERPTFWFYVPYSPQQASSGEFVLQDEKYNDVYRTPLTLPGTPGFVSLSIPPTEAPLEINKWYRWYFKLYCGPQKSPDPVFVEGWVQRVAVTPALESQLETATLPKYIVYANNLIWYDALAELRLTKPPNATLNDDWVKLLRGVDLEGLGREPIAGPVIIQSFQSKPIAH